MDKFLSIKFKSKLRFCPPIRSRLFVRLPKSYNRIVSALAIIDRKHRICNRSIVSNVETLDRIAFSWQN
ncbi:hypothetical protein C7B77_20150 [Chamaesiphon polymorphus CCALA 037]|uniref:Uncharacterized protein n=1 Tax=Chamaesiphon polymorphus CCALA 037 TaxID=2107692 RepID=A0A2T1G6I2_9CYAN|nr:hypothetical protein C7B77_20150 [Chamaesiphon polymorphus CCALA 037]